MKLLNIGFGNMVFHRAFVAIVSPDSAPIKRMIQEGRDHGEVLIEQRRTAERLVPWSYGSDHIILSAIQPDTVAARVNGKDVVEEEEHHRD